MERILQNLASVIAKREEKGQLSSVKRYGFHQILVIGAVLTSWSPDPALIVFQRPDHTSGMQCMNKLNIKVIISISLSLKAMILSP